jgi:predicted PP-loop superfamily ATPase
MLPLTLRELPRARRARVYMAALCEEDPTFALEEALLAAGKTGLGAADRQRLAADAVRYAVACHGLRDTTAARIACRSLCQGVIPSPVAVIRQARREDRRIDRQTQASLARRLRLSASASVAEARP